MFKEKNRASLLNPCPRHSHERLLIASYAHINTFIWSLEELSLISRVHSILQCEHKGEKQRTECKKKIPAKQDNLLRQEQSIYLSGKPTLVVRLVVAVSEKNRRTALRLLSVDTLKRRIQLASGASGSNRAFEKARNPSRGDHCLKHRLNSVSIKVMFFL